MLIRNYGLFWLADEITWFPGKGKQFRLLGRQGKNSPGLSLADFRWQRGIYVLYGPYGPHYVGMTRTQGLGKRLRDHRRDDHSGYWDRFSWFGFYTVLKKHNDDGTRIIKKVAGVPTGKPKTMIADTEALLIKAMGLTNKAEMRFSAEDRWEQVKQHEVDRYLAKVAS